MVAREALRLLTALALLACIVVSFFPWTSPRSPLLLAAGLLCLTGTFIVTVALNAPRNERLARMDKDLSEASAYWPIHVGEWFTWNHLRAATSLASAACCAAALAY